MQNWARIRWWLPQAKYPHIIADNPEIPVNRPNISITAFDSRLVVFARVNGTSQSDFWHSSDFQALCSLPNRHSFLIVYLYSNERSKPTWTDFRAENCIQHVAITGLLPRNSQMFEINAVTIGCHLSAAYQFIASNECQCRNIVGVYNDVRCCVYLHKALRQHCSVYTI